MSKQSATPVRTPQQRIERCLSQMPESFKGLYRKVVAGKASPRECIKAFCGECMGWERSEVQRCDSAACPLHRLRPYQCKKTKPAEAVNGCVENRKADLGGIPG